MWWSSPSSEIRAAAISARFYDLSAFLRFSTERLNSPICGPPFAVV